MSAASSLRSLILLLFILCQCCYIQAQNNNTNNNTDYPVFDALLLEDTSGTLVNTLKFMGKTIYVDFWFLSCPPCIYEIPYSNKLQQYFAKDTSVVFLSICIDNKEEKNNWKNLIREKQIQGIHLFYARNKPQKVNLLRRYNITFPTFLLLNNKMQVLGINVPRPSEWNAVRWIIEMGKHNMPVNKSMCMINANHPDYERFLMKSQVPETH